MIGQRALLLLALFLAGPLAVVTAPPSTNPEAIGRKGTETCPE